MFILNYQIYVYVQSVMYNTNIITVIQNQEYHRNCMKRVNKVSFSAIALNQKFNGNKKVTAKQNTTDPFERISQDKKRQWISAIHQTNQQAQLMRVIHHNQSSEKYFRRIGSANYINRQSSSLIKPLKNNAKKVCNETSSNIKMKNLFKSRNTNHQQSQQKQKVLKKTLKTSKLNEDLKINIKKVRNRKNSLFNINDKTKQVYVEQERPIYRIGANMQFQAKLQETHIKKIYKTMTTNQQIIPITYCIKDPSQQFNPSPLQSRNQQIPINICLFTQSLDPKVQKSLKKRKQYILKFLKMMGGTYDPTILCRIPMQHVKSQKFDINCYFKALKRFEEKLNNTAKQSIKGIFNKLLLAYNSSSNQGINSELVQCLEQQVLDAYSLGNSIAKLDYFLKKKQNKFGLQQSLMCQLSEYICHKKQYTSSLRINYHGGYSKTHHSQWHKFYKDSLTKVEKKLTRYHNKVQQTNTWLQSFINLNFIQINYFVSRQKPISISQFQKLQNVRIKKITSYLESAWSSGIYSIILEKFAQKFDKKMKNNFLEDFSPIQLWKLKLEHLSENQELRAYQNVIIKIIQQSKMKKFILTDMFKHKRLYSRQQQKKHCQNQPQESLQILLNIFYQSIISRSIQGYIDMIKNSQKPLFSLQLIVDRQTLRFKQSQQKVIDGLVSIIDNLLKLQFKLNQQNSPKQQKNSNYEQNSSSRFGSDGSFDRNLTLRPFLISYKCKDIHSKAIQNFISTIRQNYRQAQLIVQKFAQFMPFIKLTAKDKILVQEDTCVSKDQWDIAEQIFIKNLNSVLSYSQKLQKIPKITVKGIFQINCQQPLKLLNQRLNQLGYISQQKYLNKVYERIHQHEQEIAKIMTVSHCNNISAQNMNQVLQKFDIYMSELEKVKENMKDLAKRIYFYVEKKPKSNTLIARYHQLIIKRTQLIKQIKQLKQKAIYDCIILQKQFSQLTAQTINKTAAIQSKVLSLMEMYFDSSKIDNFVIKINIVKSDFDEIMSKITPQLEKNLGNHYEKMIELDQKINAMYQHWLNISNFYNNSKILHLLSLNQINIDEYIQLINKCEQKKAKFMQIFPLGLYKQQQWLLNKFQNDLLKYKGLIPCLKLLSNGQIPLQYYVDFGCQDFRNINFKKLLTIQNIDKHLIKLQEMALKATSQNHIEQQYKNIQKIMKTKKIKIIDYNGNDCIDYLETKLMLKKIQSLQFRCQGLFMKKYCQKYAFQINKLKLRIQKCKQIIESWLVVQKQYFYLEEFYRNNDDAYNYEQFKSISNLYKKIIKSFDMDNSIWLVPKNQYFIKSKETLSKMIYQLKNSMFSYFSEIKSANPRLYMLTHEQLLAIMSNIDNIPKYLPKCLPCIDSITIREDSIERLGGVLIRQAKNQKDKKNESYIAGNYLLFQEPIQIGARLSQVSQWLEKMQKLITKKLKNDYINYNQTKYPCIQITLLKLRLSFTSQVEQILRSTDKERLDKFTFINKNLDRKIEKCKKQICQKSQYQSQMKILTYLKQKQIINMLIDQKVESTIQYDWIKMPRFYSQLSKDQKNRSQVRIQFYQQTYSYGYMFIEGLQSLIYGDIGIMGNYLIGKRGYGKKQLIKNLACQTGNQLFTLEANKAASEEILNIINFFKISVFCGSWLIFPEIDKLSETSICIIGECLRIVENALKQKSKQIKLFNCRPIRFTPTHNFYFTSQTYDNRLDQKLKNYLKPEWITKPSIQFLFNLSKLIYKPLENNQTLQNNDKSIQIYKVIEFLHWNSNREDLPLQFIRNIGFYLENCYKKIQKQNKQYQVTEDQIIDKLHQMKFIRISHIDKNDQIQLKAKLHEQRDFIACYINSSDVYKLLQCKLDKKCQKIFVRNAEINWLKFSQYLLKSFSGKRLSLIIQNGLNMHLNIIEHTRYIQNCKVIYLQKWQNLQKQCVLRYKYHIIAVQYNQFAHKPKYLNRDLKQSQNLNKKSKKVNHKKIAFKDYDTNDLQLHALKPQIPQNINQLFSSLKQDILIEYMNIKRIQQIYKILQSLYEKLSSQCQQDDQYVFIFLVVWLYGMYVQESILQEWALQKQIIKQKQIKYSSRLKINHQKQQLNKNIGKNLSILSSSNTKYPIVVYNTQNTPQIIQNLIKYPIQCMHVYPHSVKTVKQFKQIINHFNYSYCQTKQITNNIIKQVCSPKNTVQLCQDSVMKPRELVIHSMQLIQENNKELSVLVKQLAVNGETYVIESGELQKLTIDNVIFVIQYAKMKESSHCLESNKIIQIQMKHKDLKQIQRQKFYKFCQQKLSAQQLVCIDREILFEFIFKNIYRENYSFPDFNVLHKIYSQNLQTKSIQIFLKSIFIFMKISVCLQQSFTYEVFSHNLSEIINVEHQNILQNIQKSIQTEKIRFMKKFVKNLIEISSSLAIHQYVYNLMQKIYEITMFNHCIIFGTPESQSPYVLQSLPSLKGVKILELRQYFQVQKDKQKYQGRSKSLIKIYQKDLKDDNNIQRLGTQITNPYSNLNTNYVLIISLDQKYQNFKHIFEKYPFLKKYFTHLFYPQINSLQLHKLIDLQQTYKNIEKSLSQKVYCGVKKWDKPTQLYQGKCITQYFQTNLQKNNNFIIQFYENRKQIEEQQFNKYKFYKNLTEQMFDSLSDLQKQLKRIPIQRSNIRLKIELLREQIQQKKNQIRNKDSERKQLANGMDLLVNMLQNKIQLVQDRQVSINRHKKQFSPSFDRIYDKIDNLSPNQTIKLKNKPDLEVLAHIRQLIFTILSAKNKMQPLKQLRNIVKQNTDKYIEQIRKISQQIKSESKMKIDKAGIVYRVLADWILLCDAMQCKVLEEIKKIEQARQKQRNSMQNLQNKIQEEKCQLQIKQKALKETQQQLAEYWSSHQSMNVQLQNLNKSQERIREVLHKFSQKQYKKKISNDLAQWLFHAGRKIMKKIINKMTLNQYDIDPYFSQILFMKFYRNQDLSQQKSKSLMEFRNFGLTENYLYHNIFEEIQLDNVLSPIQCQQQRDIDYNIIMENQRQDVIQQKQHCFERLRIIKNILSASKNIQILEDTQFYIRQLLIQKFNFRKNSQIIILTTQNTKTLRQIILNKIQIFKELLIIGPGFIDKKSIRQFYQLVNQIVLKNSNNNTKIIFLFRNINLDYVTNICRYVSCRRIGMSFYNWVRIFDKKVINSNFIQKQWEYRKCQMKLNHYMKLIFQKIEQFDPKSETSHNTLMLFLQKIEQIQMQRDQLRQVFEKQYQEFQIRSRQASLYYILYTFIEKVQKNYSISLFDQGNSLQNFLNCLKKIKNKRMQQFGDTTRTFQKFSLNIAKIMRFVSEEYVLMYSIFVILIINLADNQFYLLKIIHLIRNIDRYEQQQDKICYIINTLQKIDAMTIDQAVKVTKLPSLLSKYQDITKYFIYALSGNTLKYKKKILQQLQKYPQIHNQIWQNRKNAYYYYIGNLFDSKLTLQTKNNFKNIWIIKVKSKSYENDCIEYIGTKIKKQRKDEIGLLTMYYDKDLQIFLDKLRHVSQISCHINLVNIGQDQYEEVLNLIICSLDYRKIHHNFRIYLISNRNIDISLKEHLQYFEYDAKQLSHKILPIQQSLNLQGNKDNRICEKITQFLENVVQKLDLDQQERNKLIVGYMNKVKQGVQQKYAQKNQSDFKQIRNIIQGVLTKYSKTPIHTTITTQIINDLFQIQKQGNKKCIVNMFDQYQLQKLISQEWVKVNCAETLKHILYLAIKSYIYHDNMNSDNKPINKQIIKKLSITNLALCQNENGLCFSGYKVRSCWHRLIQNIQNINYGIFNILMVENYGQSEFVPLSELKKLLKIFQCRIRIRKQQQQQCVLPIEVQLSKKI